MAVSALAAGFVAPQGSYGVLALTVLLVGCGWNVYAYLSDKFMPGLGYAPVERGAEPGRRTATFWMSLVFYFICIAGYVWEYYR